MVKTAPDPDQEPSVPQSDRSVSQDTFRSCVHGLTLYSNETSCCWFLSNVFHLFTVLVVTKQNADRSQTVWNEKSRLVTVRTGYPDPKYILSLNGSDITTMLATCALKKSARSGEFFRCKSYISGSKKHTAPHRRESVTSSL